MNKTLLILLCAGTFLVSCRGGQEKEAATEFCDCYSDLAKVKDDAANSESATSFLGSIEEMKTIAVEAQMCRKKWDAKYNGKVDLDVFKEEVKKSDESVYNMAVEEGVL